MVCLNKGSATDALSLSLSLYIYIYTYNIILYIKFHVLNNVIYIILIQWCVRWTVPKYIIYTICTVEPVLFLS